MNRKFSFKSILSRFFFMNLTIFIVLVVIQMIAQGVFFEKYYINNKESRIEEEVENLSSYIESLENNSESKVEDIIDYMLKVSGTEKIDLSIRQKDMTKIIEIDNYMKKNYITITDEKSNKDYKIVVGDFLSGIELKTYDNIRVEGIVDNYGYIVPKKIFINNQDISIYGMDVALINPFNVKNPETDTEQQQSSMIKISGIIEDTVIKKDDLVVLKNNMSNISEDAKRAIVNNLRYTTIESLGNENNKYIISSKNIGESYIVGISQLSEVDEFLAQLDSFYMILFILAMPIVGVLSWVYSKFISKPLIDMSKVAKEISNSNFKAKYPGKSNDEIGLLGNSLNEIGSSLEGTLKELKEKIEIQKLQEQKRKELVDNISHELKTPLTIIQGNVQGYKKGVYSDKVFDDIIEETIKMNTLLVQMLEASRLEDPNFKLNKEVFDLGSTILREIDNLKVLYEEKNLKLTIDINEELQGEELVVIGDEERIREVVRNLLTNALKYTPQGDRVIITINENKESYYFSIENYGVTLNKEELNNIWEPFYRAEKSRNKKYGGNGLGLHFVKKILEAHNCSYNVYANNNSVKFDFLISKYNTD